MCRSLMPILTMASRNHMLPDDFKVKRTCHKCAMNVRRHHNSIPDHFLLYPTVPFPLVLKLCR